MTSDGESEKHRGGFFSLLGRLFGVGGGSKITAETEPAAKDEPGGPKGHSGEAGGGGPAEAAADPSRRPAQDVGEDADDADGGDELILGPELQAASANAGDEEGGLMLTGELAADASGHGGLADDAAEPEEEAIIAQLRSSLQAQSEDPGAPGEPALGRSEDEWAAGFEQVEAVGAPEEDSESGLGADSGGARGEGGPAEGDEGPESPKFMEAGEMGRKKKTKPDDDGVKEEGEAQAGAVPLFPGVQAPDPEAARDEDVASEDAEEDRVDTRDDSAEDEPGTEEPVAERAETVEAGSEEPEAAVIGAQDLAVAEAEDSEPGEAVAEESRTEDAEAEAEGAEPVSAEEVLALAAEAESGGSPAAGEVPDDPGAERPEGDIEETVRRLIREELAGELGERLSANIRRMIREEVTHALLRQR